MKLKTILILMLFLHGVVQAQQVGRDSILLYERSLDRPLTLHKGQLRVNGGYTLSLFSARFDPDAERIQLQDEGRTNVQHSLVADIQYGINDFIQAGVQVINRTENHRGKEYFLINATNATTIHNIRQIKGLEDLLVLMTLRAPWKTTRFDLAGSAGATLPTAKSQPDKPLHSLERIDETTSTMTYHDVEHWGIGVPRLVTGLRGKFRSRKAGLNLAVNYRHAFGESDGVRWKYTTVDDKFLYDQIKYKYQVADELEVTLSAEYQVFPWVDIFLGADQIMRSGGWSEYSGQKKSTGDERLTSIHFAFEILITHRLFMRQFFSNAVAGENSYAPFMMSTTMYYSLFP